MERVKDIQAVAHNWANCIGEAAKASNLFFEGAEIYSYGRHFLIARHVKNAAGEHAVLFTERTYSRTTSKHVSMVSRASSHLNKLFVPDPALTKGELFDSWHSSIITIAHHLEQARRPAKYLLEIQRVFSEAQRYAGFFGYELPALLVEAGHIQNQSQFAGHLERERDLRERAAARERKKRVEAQKAKLKDWRNFKACSVGTVDGFDYLRLNKENGQVETTQGVEFPLEAGHQLYRLVLERNSKGGCSGCGETFLGRYTITEINNAFIRVGCHKVSLKEIKLFAKQQGW